MNDLNVIFFILLLYNVYNSYYEGLMLLKVLMCYNNLLNHLFVLT